MYVIIFFILHWYVSLFMHSFFCHRYAAHKMFSMSKFWEKVFFIFSFIAQGPSYLSPYVYGILHRMHHAYADTEKDVHSPIHDKSIFRMMFKTKRIYSDIFYGKVKIEERFTKNLPKWHIFDHFGDKWYIRSLWGIIYVAIYYLLGAQWWMYFTLLPIQIIALPAQGAIINWFAHKIGYRNFSTEDYSKNLMPLDLIMIGEGYHNNHHKFSSRANFGKRWFEIDMTYLGILMFNFLGIIKLNPSAAATKS